MVKSEANPERIASEKADFTTIISVGNFVWIDEWMLRQDVKLRLETAANLGA